MSSALATRFQRFPYLVVGWALLASLSVVAPDRLFLTHRQGLWLGLAFVGIALMRGARQVGRELPSEIGTLKLSHLPHQDQMQYMGHGFSWDTQHANEMLATERDSKALAGRERKPGDSGGVAVIHAVGCREEAPVFLPLSDLEGHMLVSGATRTGKTYYLQLDLVQAIERGSEAVIFIDPKGDLTVLHRAYDAAVRAGRQKEVGRLAFPGFVDLLSQAGGQGLMAVLAFQSVADLVSGLGSAGAQQILDNTNTKLWFRATDHATAKTFSDIAGQGPLLTRRESAAYRPVLPGKPARNGLAFDATFAQQSTEVVENLVREDWLMKLPRGQAFLYASGQTYKTRFPLMPEPKNRFPLEAAA